MKLLIVLICLLLIQIPLKAEETSAIDLLNRFNALMRESKDQIADSVQDRIKSLLCDTFVRRHVAGGVESLTERNCKKDSKSKFAAYDKAVERMTDVNNWGQDQGFSDSEFKLHDENGNRLNRPARVGDFIRIRISFRPVDRIDGLFGSASDLAIKGTEQFVWVRIVHAGAATQEQCAKLGVDRRFVISVKPTYDPTKKPPTKVTEHFFSSLASNNFYVNEKDNRITVGVHGFNEVANLERGVSNIQGAKNLMIANMGWGPTMTNQSRRAGDWGLQKETWKGFMNYITKDLVTGNCHDK